MYEPYKVLQAIDLRSTHYSKKCFKPKVVRRETNNSKFNLKKKLIF